MHRHLRYFAPSLLVFFLVVTASGADKRVLMVGIDGAGGAYMQSASTPNLDALGAAGAVGYDWLNEGALVTDPPDRFGASGVNWSTVNTGASAASHGVTDNTFDGHNFANFPHWFQYIKQNDPTRFTASIVNWAPINEQIVPSEYADLKIEFSDQRSDVEDELVRDEVVTLLNSGDPDAIFVHFDQVDFMGHNYSWGSPEYLAGIETVDSLVGDILTALNARPGVIDADEDWLVMVVADHGGARDEFLHVASQGPINWEVPFIISGPSVSEGVSLPQGTLRDLVPTALWHLGIDPFTTAVEGHVVGIDFGSPNGIDGDVNQDGRLAGDGTGPAATDDVTAFVDGWLTTGFGSMLDAYNHGDLNLDRQTNLADWQIFNQLDPAMGQAARDALGVPEPVSVWQLFVAVAMGGLRVRLARHGLRNESPHYDRFTT